MDGVVHFRVRPCDSLGREMIKSNLTASTYWTNMPANAKLEYNPSDIVCNRSDSSLWRHYFYSNAMPAFLELELGILEPQTYQRMKAFPGGALQRQFMTNQPQAVHFFRKIIPIRNQKP